MATESKTYLPTGMPAPEPTRDGLDREFWEAAKRHELVVQKCNSCGTFQFPAEWICHKCHTLDVDGIAYPAAAASTAGSAYGTPPTPP